MFLLNGERVEVKRFTDKTSSIDLAGIPLTDDVQILTWQYEGDEELATLLFLTEYLRENGKSRIELFLPYVPNARMDRVKFDTEIFTLKYFCKIINMLQFEHVHVFDPHSSVCTDELEHCEIDWPDKVINRMLSELGENTVVCFPDRGAYERYSGMVDHPTICFKKQREWKTREIQYHELLPTNIDLNGKTIVIIDDICSSGGTMLNVAKILKTEYNVDKVFAYVSHCENGVVNSNLIKSPCFDGMFTTNSIYNGSHPKIQTMEIPW